ncbi:MAG: GAF domain-containing protein [Actinomycetaceae bacterium]|nr:GAF domain-containing protein [Actinomycetaceae bacterium]
MLLEAALGITKQLDIEQVLQEYVDKAASLTGAPFGALIVLNAWGDTIMFLMHGFSPQEAQAMSVAPILRGLVGAIPPSGYLMINDLEDNPHYAPIVTETIAISNFVGVPIRVKDQLFGRLFLADKPGGFTETDVKLLQFLSDAAGVAVENARLYQEANARERWMTATQEITSALLEGTDEEDALALIAKTVREVSDSDTALIVLPSVGDTWVCEIADGYRADQLIGSEFSDRGRAMAVLHAGAGMLVNSFARASTVRVPELRRFGPALYAPLVNHRVASGVLILLRVPGRMPYEPSDLPLAEGLATQAAFALEIAEARLMEDMNALLDERDRISRDLHDFAIQQLFATGMQIENAKASISQTEPDVERIQEILDGALSAVDESVSQIRAIVHNLREPDRDVDIVERVRRETSIAREALGFAPSLVVEIEGNCEGEDETDELREIGGRIDPDLADDITAVIREGLSNVARHAHATAALVKITYQPDLEVPQVQIIVEDDGVGIAPDRERTSGIGNLATRARRHGGSMSISRCETGCGTRMVWTAPV